MMLHNAAQSSLMSTDIVLLLLLGHHALMDVLVLLGVVYLQA